MALFQITQLPPGPATGAFTITASDTQRLPFETRGLYVGSAGNITVVMANQAAANPNSPTSVTVVFNAVPAGTLLPISVAYVMNNGTTAGNMVGVY